MNVTQNLQKWGNSVGVRIPKQVVKEAHLKLGDSVKFTVKGKSVIITPVQDRKITLEYLLKGVKPSDVGGEYDWGPAVGKEIW